MNYTRIAAAAVVSWLVSLAVGFVVNDYILRGFVTANSGALRPDAAITGNLPLGFVFLLIGFFAFTYAFAKGYEGGNAIAEGARFGVLVAAMVTGWGLIWQYVMFPITGSLGVVMIIDAFIEIPLYGAIVGAIYRPVGTAVRRTASA